MAIVVSVLEESLFALEAAARRQAPLADLVELRLDHLRGVGEAELARVMRAIEKPVIATVHGAEAFGSFEGSVDERLDLLRCAARSGAAFVDVDWRLSLDLGEVHGKCHRIVSRHELQGTPEDLAACLAEVEAVLYEGDVVKLVTHAETCEDGLRVMRLLRERGKGLVAFASGEAGSFTRYLAPILGSPFTYAAPAELPGVPPGRATAPGQVRVNDMLGVAPPGGLGPETAVFGVVGNPARHSWSPWLFGMALKGARLDALYLPFEPEDMDAFLDLAQDANFRGFSVTAPFKARARARSKVADEVTRRVGAANTLVRDGEGWRAFNTDTPAIRETLERGFVALGQRLGAERTARGARILVLGAGGAARAAAAAVRELGGELLVSARRAAGAQDLASDFEGQAVAWEDLSRCAHQALVHCTPAGSLAQPGVLPVSEEVLRPDTVVLDAVYRPLRTPLLAAAVARGAVAVPGGEWFVRQAILQFQHFTQTAPDEALMRATFEHALREDAQG